MASDVINQVKDAEIAADKLVDDAKKKAKEIIESSKIEASNAYKGWKNSSYWQGKRRK